MPTYVYFCEINNEEFEEFHSIKTVLDECTLCKDKGLNLHVPKRLISGGSGRGIVELTGSDLTAKVKADTQKMKREIYGSEKNYSNFVGESKYQQMQTSIDKNK